MEQQRLAERLLDQEIARREHVFAQNSYALLFSSDMRMASIASEQFSRASYSLAEVYTVAAIRADFVEDSRTFLKTATRVFPGVKIPSSFVVSNALGFHGYKK